ncbi:MAG TPA: hypothetical protein VD999_05800 [Vitreimonas sp.]|nr:hypothetical protein [Vitreimonas sp.]
MIDTLASEYGWTKKSILEDVYLDELPLLFKARERRKNEEHKTLLAIIQNPHVKNPQELWQLFNASNDDKNESKELDKQAFALFKATISKNSSILVK